MTDLPPSPPRHVPSPADAGQRIACVDVPALPLQLLLLRHPDWAAWPVAVVDEDKPQGLVLQVNAKARDAGILPGLRYGPALSLLPTLRAGVVDQGAIAAGLHDLFGRLVGFTPDVEPSLNEPGVFWLDAAGMGHLYVSLEDWSTRLRKDLRALGWIAGVAVGFRRFGTYAAAKGLRGRTALVFPTPEAEDALAASVPLSLVGLAPAVREALGKLGVRTVGDFTALPVDGLAKRFGAEAELLHRFASGDLELPLNPMPVRVPIEARAELDYAEIDTIRLVWVIKPLVDRLLAQLSERGEALVELVLALELDGVAPREERIRTAEPTLASVAVMELVRLRLEAGPPSAGVTAIVATAAAVPATSDQLALFAESPRRDLAAAARAFARLRAAFGEEVVGRAVLRDRHLPEGSFGWEPMIRLAAPRPGPPQPGVLVRRLLERPEALSSEGFGRHGGGTDGWLLRGAAAGPVERLLGPYKLAGGWWRTEIRRDYYFAELGRGDLLWVFWDHQRRRWYLHGEVS